MPMFGITTAAAFFTKVQEDLAIFETDVADPSKAINCILSAYHLHEWVWARWLKSQCPLRLRGHLVTDRRSFIKWIATECPQFGLLQQLANGSKHCSPVAAPTEKIEGYGAGPYGIGPYGRPYLLIEVDNGQGVAGSRYTTADAVLSDVVEFWRSFFDEFHPT
jgi:hypothetical protein